MGVLQDLQILGVQPILVDSSQDVKVHKGLITTCSNLYAVPLPKRKHEGVLLQQLAVYIDTDSV